MSESCITIKKICDALSENNIELSRIILKKEYPFKYVEGGKRSYSLLQILKVFMRDRFIDRYSGEKLIFPGSLKILSNIFPEEFPYHQHGKMSECHQAYWELIPTIDHIIPVTKGGMDEESNLVSTSMINNSAKGNHTIENLGWNLLPPGKFKDWDGMLPWFINYVEDNQQFLDDPYIKKWYKVAKKIDLQNYYIHTN